MKKKIKIIFKKNLEGVGVFGETKEVSSGYARNYLVPRGFALYLSDLRSKEILKQKEKIETAKTKEIEKLKEVAAKLQGANIKIIAKATEKETLFAAVGADEVAKEILKSFKIKLNKKQIEMEELKKPGEKEGLIKLGQNVTAQIKVIVEAEISKKKTKK